MRSERHRIAPFACKPVDATGAGDTFGGAFVARLVAGDSLRDAGRYAAAAAALSTEGYGAVAPIPRAAAVRAALEAAGDERAAASSSPAPPAASAPASPAPSPPQATRVVATGATEAEVEAARGTPGIDVRRLDVRDGEAVAALVAALGELDVVVNCAGVIRRGAEHDPVAFAETLDINLTGTMRVCSAARAGPQGARAAASSTPRRC